MSGWDLLLNIIRLKNEFGLKNSFLDILEKIIHFHIIDEVYACELKKDRSKTCFSIDRSQELVWEGVTQTSRVH